MPDSVTFLIAQPSPLPAEEGIEGEPAALQESPKECGELEGLGEQRRDGEQGQMIWLPARMVNEFVYCPRLFFFYEFVEGVFVLSEDTERCRLLHQRVDRGEGGAEVVERRGASRGKNTPDSGESIHSQSVELGSEELGVVAKLDLVEGHEGLRGELIPADYKAGAPRRNGAGEIELWPTDQIQLGLQIPLLQHNGYQCERGIIYNWATKQRVEWRIDAEAERWIRDQVAAARELVRRSIRPAPLRDSPKCVRCSLAPVCLPDVTHLWKEGVQQAAGEEAIGVEELPPEQTDLRERKTAANLPHSETAAQEARVSAGFIAG
ncbi:MAG: CRISPR-associated protein Cas4, partial [Chthoniobacterales bacterium]|nr:CRISPR-associated protein Cas4 [Chthoniobacterales bacterium]